MFCNQCGAELQAGQVYCARCGKAVAGPVSQPSNRVGEHVKLVGILWMAYSALQAVGGLMALLFARLVITRLLVVPNGPPPEMFLWLRPFLGVIGWLILCKGAVGFLTGWGLLQREGWARVLALVMGFLALLSVPIGTALGIYTLWVLLPSESEQQYRQVAAAG
jgi:zinc-ribbon domain